MKVQLFFFLKQASFYGAAAIVCLSFGVARSADAQRLPPTVVPVHYTLALTPDLKNATFSGVESIDVNVTEPTRTITLNAIEIVFQSVTATFGCFTTDQACAMNGVLGAPEISLDKEKQQATFTFPNEIGPGKIVLNIRYTGILNNELRGFYLSKTSRRNYAVTQFEATDARRAFPCFDEPAFKATFDISLVIDAGDTAISNSAIVSDKPGPAPNKHTIVFGETPKMSTYLVAFLVGDFQCTGGEQDGVSLRVCSTPEQARLTGFAMDVAKFALHYYDQYFGIHYPLPKLDLVGIPDFEAGAMENFGAITFREEALLIDPATASLRTRTEAAVDITHEMAHQWFGDLVTMQWWNNIWLNEGFASWMENKPVAAMHPEWNIPQLVAGDKQDTLNVDAQPTTRPIRADASTPAEINQLFDSIAYGKASDVLLMVENYLGPETFRQGVHAYLAAHEYGNATAQDFWNAEATTSHKPVDKIMESLVVQSGVPILAFGAPVAGNVSVSQARFYLSPSIKPDPGQKWTLPVCFKTASGSPDCELVTPTTSSLKVPPDALFFANAGGKGYFRSAYEPAQYAALVDRVESGLTPAERISLTGDEWARVRSDKATVGDYLRLAAALKSDPEAKVLSLAISGLAGIYDQVASTNEERAALARWTRQNFAPEYAKLGPPSPDDTPNKQELRAQLFMLLGYHGTDPDVAAQAREIANRYLADPASVEPTLAQAALGVAAEDGDATLFDRLQNIYETSSDPAAQEGALYLLPQFNNPALLDRALAYAISNKVRNQDAAILFAIGLQVPENRNRTWQFIKTHWEQVHAQLTTDSGSIMVSGAGSFCSTEAEDDVKNFFAQHKVESADVSVKHSLERIDECVEFRRLQAPNLKSWIASEPVM